MISGKPFIAFFNSEKSSGIVLVLCTVLSLFFANSRFATPYLQFWESSIHHHSITHWINDGLMTIFFLLIGLELKQEIYAGQLSSFKNAIFPVIGAAGGMLVPASIYYFINKNTDAVSGAGIPMATDIAFALGILSLLGHRVPLSLKVFLTALAVIDDLGAILCIAIFYTKEIDWTNLGLAIAIFALLLAMNKLKVSKLVSYLFGGFFMWYFMLHSGVHATISGVLLAFAIPSANGKKENSAIILQHYLHRPVAFFILPLFAFANTAIVFPAAWVSDLSGGNSLGILAGLILGKPIGILLFTFVAVLSGICHLPSGINWKHIAAVGMLAGIGFTMSVFITLLAFEDNDYVVSSKVAILFSSFFAAIIGLVFLHFSLKNKSGKLIA